MPKPRQKRHKVEPKAGEATGDREAEPAPVVVDAGPSSEEDEIDAAVLVMDEETRNPHDAEDGVPLVAPDGGGGFYYRTEQVRVGIYDVFFKHEDSGIEYKAGQLQELPVTGVTAAMRFWMRCKLPGHKCCSRIRGATFSESAEDWNVIERVLVNWLHRGLSYGNKADPLRSTGPAVDPSPARTCEWR